MARLWSSGFELNSVTSGVEWTNSVSINPTIQGTTVRSGTYAAQITSLTSGDATGLYYYFNATGTNIAYSRFYLNVNAAPSADNLICLFDSGAGVISTPGAIKLTSTRTLKLFDDAGNQVGSASSALTADTWYRIEIGLDMSGDAGTHVLVAKIDGTTFASTTTGSFGNNVSSLCLGGNLLMEAQTTGNWFFDDVAINDSAGSFQNSYPGEGEIIHLRPNAVGDNSDWTPTAGDNYTNVDEVTPDDTTTRCSTGTDEDIDDYNLDATPAALASDDVINCVQVGGRFARSNAAADGGFVFRIKAAASGTVEESSEIQISATAYKTNAVGNIKNYPLTLYDLPGASATAWTKADLDTAQIGVRINTAVGVGQNYRLSTMWLLVDHKPAAAGSSTSPSSSASASISPSASRSPSASVSASRSPSASSSASRSPSASISSSISPSASRSPSYSSSASRSRSASV